MKKIKLIYFALLSIFLSQFVKGQNQREAFQHQMEDTSMVFMSSEVMPSFPNGQLFNYLKEKIKSPGFNGDVYVSFVVRTTGKVAQVKILKGTEGHKEVDAIILEAFNKMPNWNPAKQNGFKINLQMNLKIKVEA